jgi:hypothetical protein
VIVQVGDEIEIETKPIEPFAETPADVAFPELEDLIGTHGISHVLSVLFLLEHKWLNHTQGYWMLRGRQPKDANERDGHADWLRGLWRQACDLRSAPMCERVRRLTKVDQTEN